MKSIITYILLFAVAISTAQQNNTEDIPFIIRRGVPIVKLTINGKDRNFLLDTGSQNSMLVVQYADALGFDVLEMPFESVNGAGGTGKMYITRKAEVSYNEKIIHTKFKASNLSVVSRALNIVGILGGDFLKKGYVIDYVNKKLIRL